MKFRTILFILIIGGHFNNLYASRIIVSSDIGFDPIDNTNFLQFAFDETTEDTIVVDNVGLDWNTGPLRLERNDITIIFEEGVVLRALPGEFDIFESLINVNDKSNINIIGYKATFIMNKQEYVDLADSEFRHGISLNSATNIVIEGLTILDTGGDGIIVTRSFQPNSLKNYCENVLIKNCRFSNNYRQGLSVTSAKDLTILNCEFSDTNGTLPEDGIDLEPDTPGERLENILIKDCRIFNNFGNAIQLALFMMQDSSLDVSITVENTYMANNHHPSNTFDFAEIAATDNGSNGVDGFVNFNNCYINSSQWTAVYASKTVESYDLNFTNCVFKDVSNDPINLNNPIFLEVTDYDNPVPRFGGLSFTDCAIIYDENIPFLNVVENIPTSDGLGDITGNFFIINPNDAGFSLGSNPDNVNISYEYFESFPVSEINLSTTQLNYLEADKYIEFEITRNGNLETPIAVEFEYNGSAEYGIDYDRANGFSIIPSNSSFANDTIEIIQDINDEPVENLDMSIIQNDCINLGQVNELEFLINDILTSTHDEVGLEYHDLKIYPNPVNDIIHIQVNASKYDVKFLDINGGILESHNNQYDFTLINIEPYTTGIYFVQILNKTKNTVTSHKIIKN